jgi:hypothetical protein
MRLQRQQRDRESREPGLEHGERLDRHLGRVGGRAHFFRIGPEQLEQVASLGIDGPPQRDGGRRCLVLSGRVDLEADALGGVERVCERVAHREAALRQEVNRAEQPDGAFAAGHLPERRFRARGA